MQDGAGKSRRNRFLAALGFFALMTVSIPVQAETQQSPEQMAAELKALRARLDQLEKQQTETSEKVSKAAADRAVDAALKDAEKHSGFLDASEGWTAGYQADKGFVVRSGDGNFLFHPWIQLAFRAEANHRDDGKASGDDTQEGFEVRRAKIGFDGNLWGPDFKYTFIWATDRKSGALGLEEAWFVYKFMDKGPLPESLSVQAGQFKNYFAHESMASSKKIFAVERSLLNDVFTGGDNFIQGVGLIYNEGTKGGPLQIGVVFNDGSNDFSSPPSTQSRNFQDFPNNKWDWGTAARVQYKVFGEWKDYEDFTAATSGARDLLVIGGGVDYSEAGDFGQFLTTADVQWKSGPLALYGAYMGRYLRHGGVGGAGSGTANPATAGTGNFYDWGLMGKAGYMLSNQWEVYGQYSYIDFDNGEFAAGTETVTHEIILGVNYYMHGHSAKFTLDGVWLPNGTPVSNDGSGVLIESNGKNEFILRAQFQLLL
jgi:hypothetical protein